MTTEETIAALDRGEVRAAEKVDGEWRVNEDVKTAILDYFRIRKLEPIEAGPYDISTDPLARLRQTRRLVVPPATARSGARTFAPGVG